MNNTNTIINGNCLDYLDQIPREAYIITDPPYNQKYHYDSYKDNLGHLEYQNLLQQVFTGRKSVIIHYPEQTINLLGGGGYWGMLRLCILGIS